MTTYRAYEIMLQQAAARWFSKCGIAAAPMYPFVVASAEDWAQNLLVPEVAAYLRRERVALDKYLHHGLSSQAMLYNLVGPLVVQQDYEPLAQVLAQQGLVLPTTGLTAAFEYADDRIFREAGSHQPTTLDLALVDADQRPVLFLEARLREQELGRCSRYVRGLCSAPQPAQDFTLCPLHREGYLYWDVLAKLGFLEGPLAEGEMCVLSQYLGFFREIAFALAHESSFVLLYDVRNPRLERELLPMLRRYVPPSQALIAITIQALVGAIQATNRHPWIADFRQKYGMG